MAHLGERLRQQRVAMGVSLQHISEQTRIGVRYLEALEAGDFKQLPGAIFARSFVRQYAEIVGTDVSSLESELQQIFPSEDTFPPTDVKQSTLRATLQNDTLLAAEGPVWKRLPLTALSLATALVVSSLLYVGWQRVVLQNETSEPAAAQQAPAVKPPVSKARPTTPPVVPAAVTTPEPAPQPKPTTELQAPPGNGVPGAMAVRVVASQKTWVSIMANGRFLYSGILQPYEERTVTGVEWARVVIGNSTGVDLQTDGRSIGPIGPPGSVRVVVLTAGNPPRILQNIDKPPQATESEAGTKLD